MWWWDEDEAFVPPRRVDHLGDCVLVMDKFAVNACHDVTCSGYDSSKFC